jgi:hypothetical protein
MKKKWTFATVLRAAYKESDGWHVTNDGFVRCRKGLCPLGVLFTPRAKVSPCPDDVPVPRIVALRVAYAADSEGAPDRKRMLKALGLN